MQILHSNVVLLLLVCVFGTTCGAIDNLRALKPKSTKAIAENRLCAPPKARKGNSRRSATLNTQSTCLGALLEECSVLSIIEAGSTVIQTDVSQLNTLLGEDGETAKDAVLQDFLQIIRDHIAILFTGFTVPSLTDRDILSRIMKRNDAASLEMSSPGGRRLDPESIECTAAITGFLIELLSILLIPFGLGPVLQVLKTVLGNALTRNPLFRKVVIGAAFDTERPLVERAIDALEAIFFNVSPSQILNEILGELTYYQAVFMGGQILFTLLAVVATGGAWAAVFITNFALSFGLLAIAAQTMGKECREISPTSPSTKPSTLPSISPPSAVPSAQPSPFPTTFPSGPPSTEISFSPVTDSETTVSPQPSFQNSPRPTLPDGAKSGVFGDPHLSTFDRLRFDCQAAGEFITVMSLEDPSFMIQERFSAVSSTFCSQASVSTGVAIQDTNLPRIQISTPTLGTAAASSLNIVNSCPIDFYVNGVPSLLSSDVNSDIAVTQTSFRSIRIQYPSTNVIVDIGIRPSASFGCTFLVQVFIPFSFRPDETILGLLGTPNGNRGDDWRSRDGTVLTAPEVEDSTIFSQSYNYCVQNWCIRSSDESLFTYNIGGGEAFGEFFACDEDYSAEIEQALQNPIPEGLEEICGDDVYCLVDGLCGNLQDAINALQDEATVVNGQEEVNPLPSAEPSIHPSIINPGTLPEPSPEPSNMQSFSKSTKPKKPKKSKK